jgi:hypothetical protein
MEISSSPVILPSSLTNNYLTRSVVSRETVKLGDVDINAMFDALTGACHESGQCETNDITFDGWWQESGLNGEMGPIVVTMDPSGTYPTWIRNGK